MGHYKNGTLQKWDITGKGLEPAISCVRDQEAITAPARHMSET